jgi:cytochrome c556
LPTFSLIRPRQLALPLAAAFFALASHQAGSAKVNPTEPARATTALSKAEAEGIIFERQQIMLQLERDSELLGKIAAGVAPPDKLPATTRAIAQGARDSVTAFADKVPGGRSKPEVWSNYLDFMQRMEAFATNAENMAKAGEGGNVSAVTNLMIDALPCKQCHDIYREPKTS